MQPVDVDKARSKCDRVLSLDVRPDPVSTLRRLADFAERLGYPSDQYGVGTLGARLEAEVCELLGMEAALFMPSGKIAQMIALRIHTGRANCRRIAMHPRAHFEEYEGRAYQELYSMTAVQWGEYDCLPTLPELNALLAEPLGSVTLEMPLRRLGCRVMPWEDLCAVTARTRRAGVALHLDGARLWESQPFYGRPHAQIVSLFDTVYVAFDKGLGALGGGMLAGSATFINEARTWQRRAGGRSLRTFPYQLAALQALENRLPRMADYNRQARGIALVLKSIPGIRVTPDPPEANAMLVTLEGTPETLKAARLEIAREHSVWMFEDIVPVPISGLVSFEVTVREGAFAVTDGELRMLVGTLASKARLS